MKTTIIFTDSGDTIVNEETQVFDNKHIVTDAQFIPGIADVYDYFYNEGYRIALVADGEWDSFQNVFTKNGKTYWFEQWIISERVGEQKPSQKMFTTALEKMGLTEEDKPNIVMIGNNLSRDIKGANNFGITSIWLDWSPRYFHEYKENDWVPDYVVKTPEELKRLIEEIESKSNSL